LYGTIVCTVIIFYNITEPNYFSQELRGRLVTKEHGVSHHHHTSLHHHQPLYGATNQGFMSDAFDESSELEQDPPPFGSEASTSKAKAELVANADQQDIVEGEKEGEERESWDSKIMFLLATIGCV